jgi:hypothetical protein
MIRAVTDLPWACKAFDSKTARQGGAVAKTAPPLADCRGQVISDTLTEVFLPFPVQRRRAIGCPIRSANACNHKSRRCRQCRPCGPLPRWHTVCARRIPSLDSGRSARQQRCPNSYLCGSCCTPSRTVSAMSDIRRWRTGSHDPYAQSIPVADAVWQWLSIARRGPAQQACQARWRSQSACARTGPIPWPDIASRYRYEVWCYHSPRRGSVPPD